jgi:ADP-dependent NAD(P)H-hydrate dehydratase / NAD(P)H-hydrate epimerase
MRSGLGLLTVHVPKCGYIIIQISAPEAMASVDESEILFSLVPDLQKYNAIGIGPGLGLDKQTVNALTSFLNQVKVPIVLDADALNIIGNNSALISLIPRGSILTPHPKEFERLVGKWTNDFERLKKQVEFSIKTKTVVLLKGANTSVSTPDGKVYFNNTGNPGMATAGSGDLLTGLISGLLAQGYTSEETAIIAVWLHGLAGDQAVQLKSQETLIATDIIEHLSSAFSSFR